MPAVDLDLINVIVERERERDFSLPLSDILYSATSAQEVLLRTRELLESGWCKGRYHLTPEEQKTRPQYGYVSDYQNTNNDRFCLIGAIRQAAIDTEYLGNVGEIVRRVQIATGAGCALTTWNDQPERTKEEILAAIDRAICLVVDDS